MHCRVWQSEHTSYNTMVLEKVNHLSGETCIQGWYEHIAHELGLGCQSLMAGSVCAGMTGWQAKLTGAAANPEICTHTLNLFFKPWHPNSGPGAQAWTAGRPSAARAWRPRRLLLRWLQTLSPAFKP